MPPSPVFYGQFDMHSSQFDMANQYINQSGAQNQMEFLDMHPNSLDMQYIDMNYEKRPYHGLVQRVQSLNYKNALQYEKSYKKMTTITEEKNTISKSITRNSMNVSLHGKQNIISKELHMTNIAQRKRRDERSP